MAANVRMQRVEAMRRFNRFYTKQIGVLHERLVRSPFSLTEARIIYELTHKEKTTATELSGGLGLDAGYLSRLLRGLIRNGLIDRQVSETDGRQSFLALTGKGQKAFATLDSRSRRGIEAMLNKLSPSDQNLLLKAMRTIEDLLGPRSPKEVPYLLRPHQPGDMGWVIHKHGALYAEEYGWDEQFEAFVASIAAKFIQHYDPKQERCWMAEINGEIVGSVVLAKKSKTVAKLRLLLVDPKARGLGIGARLVDECIRFSRRAGYKKIILWTNSILGAARHIYEKSGFLKVHEERHHSFGHDLIGETWELSL
jgi:DNA-binding MarR family transcriptional regulator/GNAT superfamily N-acetyltransferase